MWLTVITNRPKLYTQSWGLEPDFHNSIALTQTTEFARLCFVQVNNRSTRKSLKYVQLYIFKCQVDRRLQEIENVVNFKDFVHAFSQFGGDMVELAYVSGERQNVSFICDFKLMNVKLQIIGTE